MSKVIKRLVFVGIPMLLFLVYYGVMASDMYISESRFSLRSSEGGTSVEWLALFGQSAGGTGTDAHVVLNYIESSALLSELDRDLDLKGHYQNPAADVFTRLKSNPTREEFNSYFLKQINIKYEQGSGILQLHVRAFSPEFAQQICDAILGKSEALINRLRERSIEDSLDLTREEVARAEKRLMNSRQELRAFRQEHNLLDPLAQAGAAQGLVAEFEVTTAKVRAELAEARSYMQESSARIVGLKAKIQALEEQIGTEKVRLTGEDKATINSLAADYEELTVEHGFAQKQYLSAMSSLEAARIRTESQSRYLVAFVKPTLPEQAMWPRRTYSIVISFAGILLLYGLGSLIGAAVREHAGV
jgi:capsular polysaccharide transport system permease protein